MPLGDAVNNQGIADTFAEEDDREAVDEVDAERAFFDKDDITDDIYDYVEESAEHGTNADVATVLAAIKNDEEWGRNDDGEGDELCG